MDTKYIQVAGIRGAVLAIDDQGYLWGSSIFNIGNNWKILTTNTTFTSVVGGDTDTGIAVGSRGSLWSITAPDLKVSKISKIPHPSVITNKFRWLKVVYHDVEDGDIIALDQVQRLVMLWSSERDTNKYDKVQFLSLFETWDQIAAGGEGDHAAMIHTDGTLWGFGRAHDERLGNIDKAFGITFFDTPIAIAPKNIKWKQVSCGRYHTICIRDDGTIWGFGTLLTEVINERKLWEGLPRNYKVVPGMDLLSTNNDWRSTTSSGTKCLSIKTDGTLWGLHDIWNPKIAESVKQEPEWWFKITCPHVVRQVAILTHPHLAIIDEFGSIHIINSLA